MIVGDAGLAMLVAAPTLPVIPKNRLLPSSRPGVWSPTTVVEEMICTLKSGDALDAQAIKPFWGVKH